MNKNKIINFKIYHKILNLINTTDIQYVLISDSNQIANTLKTNIPKLHYWNNSKIHLGDLINDKTGVFHTLVDFFIMTKANEIISNGSGFSMIVSEIYDIKYTTI